MALSSLNCPSFLQPLNLHHCLSKEPYFFTELCGLFWGFCWGSVRALHRENRKPRTFLPLQFLSLFFSFSSFVLCLFTPTFSIFTPHPPLSSSPLIFFFTLCLASFPFWVFCFSFPSIMKKMKGAAFQYPSVFEDSKPRFKHQALLQDFNDLEKETETAKRKLQMMKEKKMILIAEVRFLRKRYEYLTKNKSLNHHHSNGNPVQQEQLNNQVANNTTKKGKNGSRRKPAMKPLPTIYDINQKERIDRGIGFPPQNSTPSPVLDLNQKAKTSKKKTNRQRNLTQVFDLNQKERMYNGRDADANQKTITPFFDLNQISVEEEEMQTHYEELKKSLLRGDGNDEQQNDIKILACRTVGDGPSRAGKRKISWQDQVALRV